MVTHYSFQIDCDLVPVFQILVYWGLEEYVFQTDCDYYLFVLISLVKWWCQERRFRKVTTSTVPPCLSFGEKPFYNSHLVLVHLKDHEVPYVIHVPSSSGSDLHKHLTSHDFYWCSCCHYFESSRRVIQLGYVITALSFAIYFYDVHL